MKCPVCRTLYRSLGSPTPACRRCGVDLSPLIDIHDRALWHHRQAIASFQAGDYPAAAVQNDRALALYPHHPDFQAFAGQLWALQGKFAPACAAWQAAQRLNPQHPTASQCLQICQQLSLANG